MTAFTAVRVVAGVLALGIPFGALWLGTRWIPKCWARVYARVVIAPALWYVLFTPIYDRVAGRLEKGTWRCLVCGELEDRLCYGGWMLRREPTRTWTEEIDPRSFAQWYTKEVGSPHVHEWAPIGCHSLGSGWICCMKEPGRIYYRAIPTLPDTAKARTLVECVQRASASERSRMIERFGYGPREELFQEIAEQRVPPPEEFEERFAAWLDDHPEWK